MLNCIPKIVLLNFLWSINATAGVDALSIGGGINFINVINNDGNIVNSNTEYKPKVEISALKVFKFTSLEIGYSYFQGQIHYAQENNFVVAPGILHNDQSININQIYFGQRVHLAFDWLNFQFGIRECYTFSSRKTNDLWNDSISSEGYSIPPRKERFTKSMDGFYFAPTIRAYIYLGNYRGWLGYIGLAANPIFYKDMGSDFYTYGPALDVLIHFSGERKM